MPVWNPARYRQGISEAVPIWNVPLPVPTISRRTSVRVGRRRELEREFPCTRS